jgi:hypothetical protein
MRGGVAGEVRLHLDDASHAAAALFDDQQLAEEISRDEQRRARVEAAR